MCVSEVFYLGGAANEVCVCERERGTRDGGGMLSLIMMIIPLPQC